MNYRYVITNIILLITYLTCFSVLYACRDTTHEIAQETAQEVISGSCQLKILTSESLELSPTHEISVKHYASTTEHRVSRIKLQVGGILENSTIFINGKQTTRISEQVLSVGNNEFAILVSGKDHKKNHCQLTVTRLPLLRK